MTTTKKTAKQISLFIATHTLQFEGKNGKLDVPLQVMAISDGEVVRLYTSDDVTNGSTPEWRVMVPALPESQEIVSNGIKFQRNRKNFKGAAIDRVSLTATYYTVENGELVAHGRHPDADKKTAVVVEEKTPVVEETKVVDAGATNLNAELAKPRKKKGGPKGPRGPRPGSLMGMTLAELQTEFKTRTGQDAPSQSIHYMRKLVMGARRGQERVLVRKSKKTPTMVLSLDEAKALLAGPLAGASSDVASKITLFVTANTAAVAVA